MPTTASGMTFYEETMELGLYEGLTQWLDAFNAQSGGALNLGVGAKKGRHPSTTRLSSISGLVQRRSPSGTGTLTPTTHSNYEHKTIKVFRAAPLELTAQDWIDMGLSTEEGQFNYGVQLGEQEAQDYLNSVLAALVGAINAIGATAIHDITGEATKTLNFASFNSALNKLGDHRQLLRTLVSHSKPISDMIGTAITSQQIAFQVGPTTVFNGMIPFMGLREVITDSANLVNLNGSLTDTYNVLMLQPGAATVKTGPRVSAMSVITGVSGSTPENIKWLLNTQWEYEIEVKGVSYTGAGDNPNAASLLSSANWTLVSSDRKLGPGALLVSQ